MSYCFNPHCQNPDNPDRTDVCQVCQTDLFLGDRYLALQMIGQGNFGRTFLAIDRQQPNSPRCVVKQFFPHNLDNPKAVALFQQEALRLKELERHERIPELIDVLEQGGRLYLVQEWIDGENLAQELAQIGSFSEIRIRQLLLNLLPILQFIHEQQVIHRDIKPENIIRRTSDRQLYLVDFGAAKLATGTALLKTGTMIGSAAYVAPEQMRGRAVFASDLYSLGVTCIHLLTHTEPFDCYSIAQGTWVWRDYLSSPVSQKLGTVLDKLLESGTSRRYHSAAAVLKDLHSASANATVQPLIHAPKIPDSKLSTHQKTTVSHRSNKSSQQYAANQPSGSLNKNLEIAFAVVLLVGAGAALNHTPSAYEAEVYFKKHALSTVGIIKDTTSLRDCTGVGMGFGLSCRTTYTSTVQFRNSINGRTTTFSESSICSRNCKNKPVPVLYDPDRPTNVRVGTKVSPMSVASGWMIFVLLLLFGGIWIFATLSDRNRQSQ